MKAKLALIALSLVILPTAVLSLLAGHALRDRELMLQRGLEETARTALGTISAQVGATLNGCLGQVRSAMSASLTRGGSASDIEVAALRLRSAHGVVGQAYVFMNPWGFVYPEHDLPSGPGPDRTPGSDAEEKARRAALVAELRRAIASPAVDAEFIPFSVEGVSYCFSPLERHAGMYAGYRVDVDGVVRQLSIALEAAASGGLTLVAEGPGLTLTSPEAKPPGEVIVSDPFSPPERRPATPRDSPIALVRLPRPFEAWRVLAYIRDPGAIRRAGAIQSRLYVWGVALLAGGAMAGAWIVLNVAGLEIKRARSRSDFVVGVSHDLRTPVSSMRMLAESLYLGHVPDPGKQKQFHGTMVKECERLGQLIERVLFLVRFGQNVLVYRTEDVDVEDLLESVVESFRAQHQDMSAGGRAAGPTVRVSVDPGLPSITVDRSAMGQVVLNLLDNAAKYGVRPGDAAGAPTAAQIELKASFGQRRRWLLVSRPCVRIEVSDRGPGIAPRDLRRVFRRYYRSQGSAQDNVSGVGLGLALCKHVVEAHGGSIAAHSTVGEGCTFAVCLPIAAGQRANGEIVE